LVAFLGRSAAGGVHGYPRRDNAPEGVSGATVAILAAFLAGTFQASDVLESIVDYTSGKRRPG
jgi:hypothetical protein